MARSVSDDNLLLRDYRATANLAWIKFSHAVWNAFIGDLTAWVTMGDYGWSMNFDTSQGIDAVEYGRVLEYPKREIKSQTTRKPDLFR